MPLRSNSRARARLTVPLTLLCTWGVGSATADTRVTRILSIPVSKSQLSVQQTPIDTFDGRVYTANIEPGRNGDSADTSLSTRVRQGTRESDGSFTWRTFSVDDRTAANPYHTAPAIGVDRTGRVHVAYNMHNLPWQYQRTEASHDLASFRFRGQEIGKAEIDRAFYRNKTDFPTLGKAEIPGNQISYPAFFRNRSGELYLSYRFAARPDRAFADRSMSGGVARYDVASQGWTGVGGRLTLGRNDFARHPDAADEVAAVAESLGWTVYLPDLLFDADDNLHMQFFWRSGTAGRDLTRPCYVTLRSDGRFVDPDGRDRGETLGAGDCGNMGFSNSDSFFSIANSAMSREGVPHVLLSPMGERRQILRLDGSRWVREKAPWGATEIFFDRYDTLWAVASGIRLLRRPSGASEWELVHSNRGGGDCHPRAVVDESGTTAFLHTHSCDGKQVNLYEIEL